MCDCRPSVGRGKAATIRGLTTIKWRNKERRGIVSTGQCAILRDRNELRPALKSLLLLAFRATSGILNLSESSATRTISGNTLGLHALRGLSTRRKKKIPAFHHLFYLRERRRLSLNFPLRTTRLVCYRNENLLDTFRRPSVPWNYNLGGLLRYFFILYFQHWYLICIVSSNYSKILLYIYRKFQVSVTILREIEHYIEYIF